MNPQTIQEPFRSRMRGHSALDTAGRVRFGVLAVGLVVVVTFCWLLGASATTRQGIDYQVRERRIPHWVKAMEFLTRDYHYRRRSAEVTQGLTGDEAKTMAVYEWTRSAIRTTPDDLPVVDDHIQHIMIRGYGEDDQAADVFTTLLTYAGIPAFWSTFWSTEDRAIILSFVQMDGRWTVWDTRHDMVFRDRRGDIADVNELVTDPILVERAVEEATGLEHAFREAAKDGLVSWLASVTIPVPLRAQKQMVSHRLWFQIRRVLWWAKEDREVGIVLVPASG